MESSDILNTWKEIAAYLGRGVRTAQRWEHDLKLPVRRPREKDRSAVLALRSEIDRWLVARKVKEAVPPTPAEPILALKVLRSRRQHLRVELRLIEDEIKRMERRIVQRADYSGRCGRAEEDG